MNEIMNEYIKDLERENNILLTCVLILIFLFTIWFFIAIKENDDFKIKNAKLQQQVIDYKWQLEQVQYIIEHERGE